ncbi:MAG TPA: NrfD/PsrC family molybdoenzyme membrane anchor subunit [Terracidiphilus sp.]|nr:NrfD/PsrC family molybdoenzyme membrane anchor subunit [Terracidiphilus sp.]
MFMFEKALSGSRRYWAWLFALLCVIAAGAFFYLEQLSRGLGITGLSRDVSWGLYIAQFTFFVGVAASAVMVVLPYYLHSFKQFGRITILGEMLAIASVIMCILFIMVDLGQPARLLNIVRYPSPRSLMFWDMVSLGGYLMLNAAIALVTLSAERDELPPPAWIKPLIYLSIPWAVSIHTVTAFLYSGLPGRAFWLTAILAPRFLASAFAAGPALLILICLVLRKVSGFDAGEKAIGKLAVIMTYAIIINVFFVLVETFTVFYGNIPEHIEHFDFLYTGLDGVHTLVPWMWLSAAFAIAAIVLLLSPRFRRRLLPLSCALVFLSLWIEKGLGLIVGGFEPSPLGTITRYVPTLPEWTIAAGIWAIGALVITVFYKIVLAVRNEVGDRPLPEAEMAGAAHH